LGALLRLDVRGTLYAVGSLIGVWITPDLDVDRGYWLDGWVRKNLGGIAAWIWEMFWYPYRRSLKHGSPLSHAPVVSTYGRIEYVYIILIVIPHLSYYFLLSPGWDLQYVLWWYWDMIWDQREIIWGLVASDIIHWALDKLTKETNTAPHK
jgi:uncharacterized metal-binding protein